MEMNINIGPVLVVGPMTKTDVDANILCIPQ